MCVQHGFAFNYMDMQGSARTLYGDAIVLLALAQKVVTAFKRFSVEARTCLQSR
jgi:hypothetical protein